MDKKRAWFIAILFFSGLCLTLYPFVSNLIAQSHASQAIAAYDEQVAEMDQEQIDAAKEAVRKYNEQLNAAVEASAMQGEDGISYVHERQPLHDGTAYARRPRRPLHGLARP